MSTKTTGQNEDLWHHERIAWSDGYTLIAGLDEVGRGPLAGPVVAACVILPQVFESAGINDSKKLTERQRERAYTRICSEALGYGLGIVEAEEIDRINILQATHAAMRQALSRLPRHLIPSLALVDGYPIPNLPCPAQRALFGGDSKSVSIAAASIIAKVTRDRRMIEEGARYPAYGFARHKGYGAPQHLAALTAHGPCPLHRRSFAPVAVAALSVNRENERIA